MSNLCGGRWFIRMSKPSLFPPSTMLWSLRVIAAWHYLPGRDFTLEVSPDSMIYFVPYHCALLTFKIALVFTLPSSLFLLLRWAGSWCADPELSINPGLFVVVQLGPSKSSHKHHPCDKPFAFPFLLADFHQQQGKVFFWSWSRRITFHL